MRAGAVIAAIVLLVSWRAASTASLERYTLNFDEQVLVGFRNSIENWPDFSQALNLTGWVSVAECGDSSACPPVCTWTGVRCSTRNSASRVTQLLLPCQNCSAPAVGQLYHGLAYLDTLEDLNLEGNAFYGTLPAAWGDGSIAGAFQALKRLNCNRNRISGFPPLSWINTQPPAFPSLVQLELGGNQLSGSVPIEWTLANNTLPNLVILNFADNQLTGSIPAGFMNGLINVTVLKLQNNRFSGRIPSLALFPEDSYFQVKSNSIQEVWLGGNQFTGDLPGVWWQNLPSIESLSIGNMPTMGPCTVPAAWGYNGSFPKLQNLDVSGIQLTGTLPPMELGAMASLQQLNLANNNLTGTIPVSWAQLPSLQQLIVQPGNAGLCPLSPANAPFKPCIEGDDLCRALLNTSMCNASSASNTTNSTGCSCTGQCSCNESSSSFPVVAVVVPVVAVIAAAALAAFWVERRRRRKLQSETAKEHDDQAERAFYAADSWDEHDASNISSAVDLEKGSGELHSKELSSPGLPPARPSDPHSSSYGSHEAKSEPSTDVNVSDWEIDPEEIEIMKRQDGSEWLVGAGGFGKVYKALRNGVQPVAVKELAPSEELRSASEKAFRKEIAMLRSCRDSNVVMFLGACFTPDRQLLVTEYMDGGNLATAISRGQVTWNRRGKLIAIDVAKGLTFLHSKRIVHCDLKPANILLSREGKAKIGDVGLAKIASANYITAVVGTLAWSAPEMLMGRKCTTQADIYSFGVVLWEMVTGEIPVRGRLRDVKVPEECPAEVRTLILDCLTFDPRKRPKAAQLVDRLQKAPQTPLPRASLQPMQSSTTVGSSAPASPAIDAPAAAAPATRQGGAERWPKAQRDHIVQLSGNVMPSPFELAAAPASVEQQGAESADAQPGTDSRAESGSEASRGQSIGLLGCSPASLPASAASSGAGLPLAAQVPLQQQHEDCRT